MFGWVRRVLDWFRRSVKRVDAFGIGVEFHPPSAEPTTERKLPTADPPPPLSAPAPVPAKPAAPGGPPGDLLARDRRAFLAAIVEEKQTDYERVLNALIDWSVARGDVLRFEPKESKAKRPQATVSFYVRGGPLFWEVYPDPNRKDAKFCCLSSMKAPEELKKEARERLVAVSPRGVADPRGQSAPTISFDDLVTAEAQEKLLKLLDDLLRRVA